MSMSNKVSNVSSLLELGSPPAPTPERSDASSCGIDHPYDSAFRRAMNTNAKSSESHGALNNRQQGGCSRKVFRPSSVEVKGFACRVRSLEYAGLKENQSPNALQNGDSLARLLTLYEMRISGTLLPRSKDSDVT